MSRPITVKINCSRIDKNYLFAGKNGKYLDLVIWERRDGPDQFGNTHSVQQDLGKAARAEGKQNPFIGSAKFPTAGDAKAPLKANGGQSPPADGGADEDCPF